MKKMILFFICNSFVASYCMNLPAQEQKTISISFTRNGKPLDISGASSQDTIAISHEYLKNIITLDDAKENGLTEESDTIECPLVTYIDWTQYIDPYLHMVDGIAKSDNTENKHTKLQNALKEQTDEYLGKIAQYASILNIPILLDNTLEVITARYISDEYRDMFNKDPEKFNPCNLNRDNQQIVNEKILEHAQRLYSTISTNYYMTKYATPYATPRRHARLQTTKQPLCTPYHLKGVLSPNGTHLASLLNNKSIEVRNIKDIHKPYLLQGTALNVQFNTDGTKLVTGNNFSKDIRVWDVEKLTCTDTLSLNDAYYNIAINNQGSLLSRGTMHRIAIWEKNGTQWNEKAAAQTQDTMGYFVFSPNSDFLASASIITSNTTSKKIIIWNTQNMKIDKEIDLTAYATSLMFNHDGTELLSVIGNDIYIWNTQSWQPRILKGHTESIKTAKYAHHDNSIIISSAKDGIKIWDCIAKQCVETVPINQKYSPPRDVVMQSDGSITIYHIENYVAELQNTLSMYNAKKSCTLQQAMSLLCQPYDTVQIPDLETYNNAPKRSLPLHSRTFGYFCGLTSAAAIAYGLYQYPHLLSALGKSVGTFAQKQIKSFGNGLFSAAKQVFRTGINDWAHWHGYIAKKA